MPEERSRLPFAALGFAAAAAFSSWNPISAPFGLVVGLASLAIAVRALRGSGEGRRRAISASAIALSAGAILASGLVLALTAGVGRELGGVPVVPVPRGARSGASSTRRPSGRAPPGSARGPSSRRSIARKRGGRAGGPGRRARAPARRRESEPSV